MHALLESNVVPAGTNLDADVESRLEHIVDDVQKTSSHLAHTAAHLLAPASPPSPISVATAAAPANPTCCRIGKLVCVNQSREHFVRSVATWRNQVLIASGKLPEQREVIILYIRV